MPCEPPYCKGTGDWCGCNCRCCKPDPCCSTLTCVYKCGTPSESWPPDMDPNEGCVCDAALRRYTPPVEFPLFTEDGEDQFVFALTDCSIPCSQIEVTLTTTGCCFHHSPEDDMIYVVGAGEITAAGPDEICSGAADYLINGQPSPYTATDCETVSVTVQTEDGCCPCCLVRIECENDGGVAIAGMRLRPTRLSKKNIVERVKRRIRPASSASPRPKLL